MKTKPAAPALTATQKADLVTKAQLFATQQKWREAISSYKQLLALEPTPHWLQSLSDCYHARAQELQQKGLHNEALILWENCFEHAGALTAERALAYLACLLKASRPGKAAVFYNAHYELLNRLPEARPLESRFAAGLLSREAEVVKAFSPDHPLCKQSEIARQAMAAYCAGNDTAVEEALKAISFRSPFRDFAYILKALLLTTGQADQASEMLNKIAADSAFSGLAHGVKGSLLEGHALLRHTITANSDQRALISECKGWNKPQILLTHELARMGPSPSDSDKLTFLCAQKSPLINENALRTACLALLVGFPKGIKIFEKRFGRLTPFEKSHTKALAHPEDGDPRDQVRLWVDCLNDGLSADLDDLTISALSKHIATLLDDARAGGLRSSLRPEEMLKRAIACDPHDLSSHIALLKMLAGREVVKEYQEAIDEALQYFPQNREILMLAVMGSQKRKAFKKAASYAKKLLTIDPINKVARKSLVNCHLEHARKQILKKKHELANKEIALAQQYLSDADDQLDLALVNTWQAFSQGEKSAFEQAFSTATTLAAHPLTADMLLFTEGLRQRIPLSAINKTLIELTRQPFKRGRDVQTWCKHLHKTRAMAPKELSDVLVARGTEILQAVKPLQELSDFTLVCDTLHSLEACYLLREIAKHAHKLHPTQALFDFYHIYGLNWGRAKNLTHDQVHRLKDLAMDEKVKADQRTHHLIVTYLDDYYHWAMPPSPFDFDDDMDWDDDDAPEGSVLGGGPPPEFLQEMLSELKRTLPKHEFQEIEQQLKNGGPELLQSFLGFMEEVIRSGGPNASRKKRK